MVTFNLPAHPRRIPSPADIARRPTPARRRVPPELAPDRHPGARYWVETNIGIAFAHANRLDLLATHLGDQLSYVEDVLAEWELRAERIVTPPAAGAGADDRAEYQQRRRVRAACQRLLSDAPRILGEPVELPLTEAERVNAYRRELAALPPAGPAPTDVWSDRGECASVLAADLRPHEVAVLLTNDAKATKLAYNHGVATRSMVGLLREMVRAGTCGLTAEQAWGLYDQMTQVTNLRADLRPSGPEQFA